MNIDNAVSDTLENLRIAHRIRSEVTTFDENPPRSLIRLYSKDGGEMVLELEYLYDVIAVLQRNNLSRRSMNRFLDTLIDLL